MTGVFFLHFFNFCDTTHCSMATPAASPIDQSAKAVSRYQNGYRLARTISGLGHVCQAVGLLAGVLVVLFGVMGGETLMRPNPSMVGLANYQTQHNVYLVSMIFFGALVAFAGWVIGVVLTAGGQHLNATLDNAVHSSPFLTNLQRAQLMRLQ
jgi:hypothetical protein